MSKGLWFGVHIRVGCFRVLGSMVMYLLRSHA